MPWRNDPGDVVGAGVGGATSTAAGRLAAGAVGLLDVFGDGVGGGTQALVDLGQDPFFRAQPPQGGGEKMRTRHRAEV